MRRSPEASESACDPPDRVDPAARTLELARKIRERILEDNLAEGQFFMTDAQVAARFGVSRGITREAVNRLKALGVLRSRRRIGLVVGRTDPVNLFSGSLAFYGQSERNFRELSRLRYTLELGAVDLAVAGVTDEQTAAMVAVAQRLQALSGVEAPWEAVRDAEYAFHRLILEATGSALVLGMHSVLLDYFATSPRFVRPRIDQDAGEGWDHRAIAAAFVRRDVELIRALLRQHLHHVLEDAPAERTDSTHPGRPEERPSSR